MIILFVLSGNKEGYKKNQLYCPIKSSYLYVCIKFYIYSYNFFCFYFILFSIVLTQRFHSIKFVKLLKEN